MNTTVVSANKDYASNTSVSWGAIFAGVVVALFLEALLNLLGVGLGLIAFTIDTTVINNIGIGTIIWLVLTGIISLFAGGWVAGKLADPNTKVKGMLHGVTVSGFTIILSFILMTSTVGAVISGIAGMVSQTVSMAGKSAVALSKGAANVAPQITQAVKNALPDVNANITQITQQAEQVLTQVEHTNGTEANGTANNKNIASAANLKSQLKHNINALLTAANEKDSFLARQKLVVFLTQNTSMSLSEAEQAVNNWQQQFNELKAQAAQKAEEAKQTAMEAADKVTTALGTISLIAFFVFLLSAIAGALGALVATSNMLKVYGNTTYSEDHS